MKSKRVSETAEAAVAKKFELRETEMRWLHKNNETVSKYAGEWTAVEGAHLVSHSSSFADVLEATRKEGIRIPFILFVPENSTSPMIGL